MGDFMGLINQHINAKGGLQGLVSQFQAQGMGDKIKSWISTGENQPMSPEDVRQGLGDDFVNDASAKLGVPPEQVSAATAEALPRMVDQATPKGEVENNDLMGSLQNMLSGAQEQLGGVLGGLFGKKE